MAVKLVSAYSQCGGTDDFEDAIAGGRATAVAPGQTSQRASVQVSLCVAVCVYVCEAFVACLDPNP